MNKNTNYYNNNYENKPIAIEFSKSSHETLNITHDYKTDRLPMENLYQSQKHQDNRRKLTSLA